MSEFDDVVEFHQMINEEVGVKPHLLNRNAMANRVDFMREELSELQLAYAQNHLPTVFDALIDLVYVVKGTAVMMGLPWAQGWRLVHRANMRKVPGQTSRGMAHDAVKPPGWLPPDLDRLLRELS